MGTKRKSRKKHSRGRSSKLNAKLYAILSGKTHRVVALARKLTTARRRAAGLVKRGSKRVSIRRGAETFAIGAVKRTSRKRRSKKRTSRKRVSRNGRRRSKRRVSRNGRRRRHSRR